MIDLECLKRGFQEISVQMLPQHEACKDLRLVLVSACFKDSTEGSRCNRKGK